MKCPICGKPTQWQDNPARPFCSERCKLIDFGAWANEEYTVPSDEAPLSEEAHSNIVPAAEDGHDRTAQGS